MTNKLTPEHLQRRAIVYVRQSTLAQVLRNRESQLRQYNLSGYARELGFTEVETIDEDLGRSGSGLMERPGFQRLVTEVCEGRIGAIFCVEASRLARNGRDWHHLIELCGLVGALFVDPEGIYDPRVINDRLVLGLRGTMSEFELSIMRDRMFKASRQKAQRGELRFCLPVGLCWGVNNIELDADVRVQNGVHLVFRKFQELGSARQVLLWFREQQIALPAISYGDGTRHICWKLPLYSSILGILTNPMYAGAYAFGRTEARTQVLAGRARQTSGHQKPREEWTVLIRDHHPGYISWERFELNQNTVAENAHMKSRMGRQRGRGGPSLLVGLLRCRRCGRMVHVRYNNRKEMKEMRYVCVNGNINQGMAKCIGFGGVRVDQAVSMEILKVIQPLAIDAALQAADQILEQHCDRMHALQLELEQARYEARLAARRYEAIDPDNRLVASELESRWNAALCRVRELEDKVEQAPAASGNTPVVNRDDLLALAEDLPGVWESPSSDPSLKQRIIRILIQEIVADIDEHEVVLVIHWVGGRHSELRVPKLKSGHHSHCTQVEAVDIVRQMAGSYKDEEIALTLNRLRLKTGVGNSWSEKRVRSLRSHLNLPVYRAGQQDTRLNLRQAAERLAVSTTVVRRLIARKVLTATQVVPGAPWEIDATVVASPEVIHAATALKNRESHQRCPAGEGTLSLPGLYDEGMEGTDLP
jgi:DNA invertase Pin-like site-specific DNA recombinase